jgi:hypothetical protein
MTENVTYKYLEQSQFIKYFVYGLCQIFGGSLCEV